MSYALGVGPMRRSSASVPGGAPPKRLPQLPGGQADTRPLPRPDDTGRHCRYCAATRRVVRLLPLRSTLLRRP